MIFLPFNFESHEILLIPGLENIKHFPLLLAPMEDVTDPSFRFMCKKFGADLVYTEFISSDGLIRDGKKSVQKLDIFDYERPIGIQLYGHIPESMTEAARIAEKASPELIDINYGCPVKKIANRGAGAGMLRNVPLMREITRSVVQATHLPVTVKTRLGWDNDSKNIIEVALQLQDDGIKAITIHGRTRNQMYLGKADWTLIGKLKDHSSFKLPVIGNGDITSPEIAKQKIEETGVDGIMIGRAAVGRPWIFREIHHYLKTGEILPPPTLQEKVAIGKEHFFKSLQFKGNIKGIFEMRRHFVHYFKGLPDFREVKIRLLTSTNEEEILSILDEIEEKYAGFVPGI